MLNLDDVKNAVTAKTSKKKREGVRVTEGVYKRAIEGKRGDQACISVHGLGANGVFTVRLGDRDYTIIKNGSHSAWATKQVEEDGTDHTGDFVDLFNVLAESLNKFQGEFVTE